MATTHWLLKHLKLTPETMRLLELHKVATGNSYQSVVRDALADWLAAHRDEIEARARRLTGVTQEA